MSFDRYMPCPGGTGKKIKFCCEDMLAELESVQRMLEGDQRLACLEHVEKTLESYPDRPCLLSIKALLHAEMKQEQALTETLDRFEAKHPGNPVASAERAIQLAQNGRVTDGILALQTAIAAVDQQMPTRVYEAIGLLGRGLLSEGNVLAAQAHLLLQAAIGGAEDPRAMSLLAPLMRSAEIPILLRDEQRLLEHPSDSSIKPAFEAAVALGMRGAWLSAADRFAELAASHPNVAEVQHNLAILRSWLGQVREAVVAWRSYAASDSVAFDDAVEAEAIAQLIDSDVEPGMIDLVCLTFETDDLEPLAAHLTASSRTQQTPTESAIPLEEEGQPPPQAVFLLLDREMPETGVGIELADVPQVLAQCYLFGRQTDRSARLELVVYRDEKVDTTIDALNQVVGDLVKQTGDERVLAEVAESQYRLTWNWRLPADTPAADRDALVAQQRLIMLLDVWTTLPNPALSGKTPQDAAKDDRLLIAVEAAVLVLELSGGQSQSAADFVQLRQKLGLSQRSLIDAKQIDMRGLPLVRMARVDVNTLNDEQLLDAYRRSAMYMVAPAIRALAPAVIQRESLDGEVDKAEAYGILASQAEDSDVALELLGKAREIAATAGQSLAPWLLAELDIRIVRGDIDDAQRLLQELQSRHFNEPGIAQGVYELLARYGMIDPGAAAGPPGGMPAAAAGPATQEGPTPAAQAADQIWTPDAPSSGGQKKSAIWTPDD